MYTLRSINPQNGYMNEFILKDEKPVLIGRMPLDVIHEYPEGLIADMPDKNKKEIVDDIKSARVMISMRSCKIKGDRVSRVHCIIYPGEKSKIVDLSSTNGTWIASLGGGKKLEPWHKTDLKDGDIIILAKGTAIFEYSGPRKKSKDNGNRDSDGGFLPDSQKREPGGSQPFSPDKGEDSLL